MASLFTSSRAWWGRAAPCLAAALILAGGSAAAAQDQPTTLDDIVVDGARRDRETAFDYIRTVSAPPFGARTMAVWDSPICLSVENLTPGPTAVVTGRILARAGNLGVSTNSTGCRPNVIVIFSGDAHATAEDLVAGNEMVFRPTTSTTQMDRSRLRSFVERDRPVRWWSVWLPVDVDTGERTIGIRGEPGHPPKRQIRGMQPRGNNTRDALQMSFVVVDVKGATGTPLEAMGDYLAMVVLSQIDPDADVKGQPTVLNLFEPGRPVDQLTRWDQDYLTALYSASVAYDNVRFQQQEIARRMVSGDPAAD